MELISETTGAKIAPGAMLLAVEGPHMGTHWRFHELRMTDTGHRVCVSRPYTFGHIRREFHPGMFGLHVVIEISWRHHLSHSAKVVWARIDEWFLAGLVALVPLAFFEHYHWAEKITSALSG
jgi:hypothetical protein